ncbi:MAG: hypothetical protein Q4D81_08690 [Eubacteriales bacterium]|nr:hypothetical protein [Eubacteriales bacterium]
MDAASFLDRILEKMSSSHDIVRDYPAERLLPQGGRGTEEPGGCLSQDVFPAYAFYASTSEKYVLTKKASLWTICEYEHVLFLTGEKESGAEPQPEYAQRLIAGYMEPVLVRKGKKYPPRNHMRSFLTVVLLLDGSPGKELIRKIRKYRFDKGYLFSVRGYAQGRLVAVDLSAGKVYTSPAARDVADFYETVLRSAV